MYRFKTPTATTKKKEEGEKNLFNFMPCSLHCPHLIKHWDDMHYILNLRQVENPLYVVSSRPGPSTLTHIHTLTHTGQWIDRQTLDAVEDAGCG